MKFLEDICVQYRHYTFKGKLTNDESLCLITVFYGRYHVLEQTKHYQVQETIKNNRIYVVLVMLKTLMSILTSQILPPSLLSINSLLSDSIITYVLVICNVVLGNNSVSCAR